MPFSLLVQGDQESDFSHTSIANIAIGVCRIRWNDMKPGVDVVLTY